MTGRRFGTLGPCKSIAIITDETLIIAAAVNAHIRRNGSGDAFVVFVDRGDIYAPRLSSNTARALAPMQIIGTYTKRVKMRDIADDVQAWKEAA